MFDDDLVGTGQLAVAAALGREVDDHRARLHARAPCRPVISTGDFWPGIAAVVMTTSLPATTLAISSRWRL